MNKIKSIIKLRCECCHRKFVPKRTDQKFCKSECADRANKLKRRYNTTPAEIYKLYRHQNGRCAICDVKGDIQELGYKTKAPFMIDHDHDTLKIRGLLCHGCNTGLGLFRENRLFLREAIKYLSKHSGDRDYEKENSHKIEK